MITVGPNVQVSKSRSDLVHNEVLLSADPTNPSRLLGCTMAFSPEQNKVFTIAYVSFDGGKSWEPAVTSDRGIQSGDPSCVYGMNGNAYFTAIERLEPVKMHQLVYRSKDGGKTWLPPVSLLGSGPHIDRSYVVVDQSESRFQGRVYVYGQITQRAVDGES
ncbi:MAG TPA: sialidase family protein, partial [Pyrinomonadaceae bacterium]|nr:sialidase family protein [Pyrinomonadaceae bacterium]